MIEYRRQEENNYPKAYAISTGIMLALLVISYFIVASRVEPDTGTGGIIVNYGTSEFGTGDDYMSVEEPSTSPDANLTSPDKVIIENTTSNESNSEVSDKTIATQDNEEAPEVITKEKSSTKSPAISTPAKDNKPVVNQNALYKGKKNDGLGKG
ncbi:MAG: energy transducer TonB, partial [Sphingobacterium thalpophilum]